MRNKRVVLSVLLLLSLFASISLLGCGGGGGGGSTGGSTDTGGNSVTISGKLSGGLLTSSSFSAAPGEKAPGQPSIIALKNYRTEQVLDQKVVAETGDFTFTGEYKGLTVSLIVGSAQSEIIVGSISSAIPSNTVVDVAQPYRSTGGLNEDAVIASNIIKKLKLESQIVVNDARPSKLWEYIDQTKAAVDQYIKENPVATRTTIVAEINQPSSASFGSIAGKMNLTTEKFDHFDFSSTSPQKAGGTIEITLSAKDAFGNIISTYARNGTMSIAGATGTVAWGGAGVVNKGGGTGSFSAATFSGGVGKVAISNTAIDSSKSVTFTDTTTNKSSTVVVSWIDATQLDRFEIVPSSAAAKSAGVAFQVTIRALDISNNVKTNFNSTVNISDSTATVSPMISGTFTNGVWTGNLAITKADAKAVVTVSGAGKTGTCEVVVSPGSASKLLITTQPPAAATAGTAFATLTAPVKISVCDSFNNVITTDNATVITAERGTVGTSALQGTTTAAVVSGVASFTNLSYIKAEGMKVKFRSGSLASAESTLVDVAASTLNRFDLTSNSPQVTGSVISLTAVAKDTYGNTITSFASPGMVSIAGVTGVTWSGKGVKPDGEYDGTGFVSGIATIGVTNTVVSSNKTITLKDTTTAITATTTVSWISGSFHHFELSSITSPKTAGAPFSVTITAKDAFGNTDTTYTAPATLTDTTGTINPTITGAFVNGTWTGNVSVRKAQSNIVITVTAASRPGNSNSFTVNPDSTINRYVITQAANQIAGAGFFGTVAAKDAYDNTITTNSSVTLTLTTTATGATFYTDSNYLSSKPAPVIYNLTNGVAYYYIKNRKVETFTITATDGSKSVTSDNITTSADIASKLVIKVQPDAAPTAGIQFAQQPQIQICDAYGNVITSDNSTVVTASVGSLGTSTLQGTVTKQVANGVATFTDLSYKKAEQMIINFTAIGLTSVESNKITVGSDVAEKLVVTRQPSTLAVAGNPFSVQPWVAVYDKNDNIVSNYVGNITAGIGTVGVSLIKGTTTKAVVGGVVQFTDLKYEKAEQFNIEFSSGGLVKAYTVVTTVSPNVPNKLVMNQQPPANTTAGAVFGIQPKINITDAYSNVITTDNSTTITATAIQENNLNPSSDTLKGGVTAKAVAGVATYTNLSYNKQENIRLNFNGPQSAGLATVQSNVIAVGASTTLDHFDITAAPVTQTAGQPIALNVTAKDSFNNTIKTFNSDGTLTIAGTTGTITWSGTGVTDQADPNGTYAGATAFVNGVATINITNTAADQNKMITVTDTQSGKTVTITVSWVSGVFAKFIINTVTSPQTAGIPFQITVKAVDANNNVDPTYNAAANLSNTTNSISPTTTPVFSNGIWTGNVTITKTATSDVITATAAGKNGLSNAFDVNPGAAAKLVISQQPSANATAGTAFPQQPQVQIVDANNNIRTTDNSTTITAARGSTGTDVLKGTVTAKVSSGVATFTGLKYEKAEDMTIIFSAPGVTGAESNVVVVGPAAIANYSVASATPQIAGVGFTNTITARDAYNNVVKTDSTTNVTVTTSTTDPAKVTFYTDASYAVAKNAPVTYQLVNGVASYYLKDTKAESIIVSVTDGNNKLGSSSPIVIGPAAANKLIIKQQPSTTAVSGVPFAIQPQITIADTYDNTVVIDNTTIVTAARGTVGTATLQGTVAARATNGIATFTNLAYLKAEDMKVKFTATGLTQAESDQITVSAGAFHHYSITSDTPQTAGNSITLTVTAKDSSENTLASHNSGGTLTIAGTTGSITWTGTGVTDGVDPAGSFSGAAFTNGVASIRVSNSKADQSKVATITDTSSGLATASAPLSWVSGALAKFLISNIASPQVAGVPFQVTITAADVNSNTDPSFAATVSLTATTGAGTISPATTSEFINGVWTGNVTISKAGTSVSITASGAGKNGVSGVFDVNAGSGSKLVMIQQPSTTAIAGSAFTTQPQVAVADSNGNIKTDDNSTIISVARGSVGNDVLKGTLTAKVSNGIATFTGLKYEKAEDMNLDFTATGFTHVESNNISVRAASPAKLVMHRQPSSSATAGFALTVQPQIAIADQYNNIVTSDNTTLVTAERGTVGNDTLKVTGGGTLTATASAGIVTFVGLKYEKAEQFNILFTSGSLSGAESNNVTVSAASASKLVIVVQPSSPSPAGAAFVTQPQISICDAYGNVRTADSTTNVTASRGSVGTAVLGGTLTKKAVNGIVTFTDLSYPKAEDMKIKFTATGLTQAESDLVTITAGGLDHFDYTTDSPQVAGQFITITITAKDVNNNVITTFNQGGSLTIASTTGAITWTGSGVTDGADPNGSYSGGAFTNGVAQIKVSNSAAENNKIATIRDDTTSKFINATLSWVAGNIDHFTIAAIGNQVAGNSFAITITAKDAGNNTIPGYTATANLADTTGTISPAVTGNFNAGSWTGNVTISQAQNGVTITASGASKSGTSNAFNVTAGAFSKFIVTPANAASIASGGNIDGTITAVDASNNPVNLGANTTVVMSTTGSGSAGFYTDAGRGTGTTTYVIASGSSSVTYYGKALTVTSPGNPLQVKATQQGGSTNGLSANITITPGALAKFAVTASPLTQVAGGAIDGTITAKDANDNDVTVTSDTLIDVVKLGVGGMSFYSDAGRSSATSSYTITNGGTSVTYYGKATTVGAVQAKATKNGDAAITGTSPSVTVTAGGFSKFAVTPAGAVAYNGGASVDGSITLKDAYDNTTTFAGDVTITISKSGSGDAIFYSSDANRTAGTPTTTSYTIASGGTSVNYFAKVTTQGQINVVATKNDDPTKTGQSATITINTGAFSKFIVTAAPTTLASGDNIDGVIKATDAGGNAVNVGANTTVNMSVAGGGGVNFYSDAGRGGATITSYVIISGNSQIAYYGKATTLGTATITATKQAGTETGSSPLLTIGTAGTLAKFIVTANPTSLASGADLEGTITASDAFNNPVNVTGDTVVNMTVTGGGGGGITFYTTTGRTVTTTSYTITNGNNQITYYGRTTTSGTCNVTATKNASTETGSSPQITVGSGTFDHLILTLESPQKADGTAFTGTNTLRAVDASNNTVTTFNASADNVTITVETGGGTVSGLNGSNVLNQAGDFVSGICNLTGRMKYTGTTGVKTFKATSGTGKVGTSGNVTAEGGALNSFTFTGIPDPAQTKYATNRIPLAITVTAKDSGGNTVTSYTGTPNMTINSGTLVPSGQMAAFTAGVWTGNVTVTVAGGTADNLQLTVNDTALGKSSNSTSFGVRKGSIVFERNPSTTGNATVALAVQPKLKVLDANGVVLTNHNGITIDAKTATGGSLVQYINPGYSGPDGLGIVTFYGADSDPARVGDGLKYNTAGTYTIRFTFGSDGGDGQTVTSGNITINP